MVRTPEFAYEPLGKWEPAMTPGVVALALGAGALLGFGLVRAAARLADGRRDSRAIGIARRDERGT